MKLQSIYLINRAPFVRLELNFGDESIAVLSGINGSGKTTIISHIVDAFYELARLAFSQEFEHNHDKYYRLSADLFSLDNSKPSIVYLRFLNDDGAIIDYVDARGLHSESEYNSLVSLADKIPYSSVVNTREKSNVKKHWSINNKDEISRIYSSSILTYFPAYRYETPAYLNDPFKIKLEFDTSLRYAGYLVNPIEVSSDLPQIANWIMDIVLDHELYKGTATRAFSSLNTVLTSILSAKFGFKTRFGIGPRTRSESRIAIMNWDNNVDEVYPSVFNMSSGELAMLCLFGELVKQSDRIGQAISDISGIVLVDEIDKHLHIKLQKEVLPKLIALFPNVQFIVTSHSPFLALGLANSQSAAYAIYDLDNGGIPCQPLENELFLDVYNMIIAENNRFASKYLNLKNAIANSSKPIIITEGKTDWKHLEAAMKALNISDLDIELYRYCDALGDTVLLKLLEDYARIPQSRLIIGVFDRDNFDVLKRARLSSEEFIPIGGNVYAFAIPLVNENEYGSKISIEHYYTRNDLTKLDENGRRLFLGDEFYESGFSKDRRFHAKTKGIDTKAANNGIVDEKVYDVSNDPKEENSLALTKSDFADLVIGNSGFADGFDFSNFNKIFDVIRKIVSVSNSTIHTS